MDEAPERKSVVATKRGDDGTTGLLFGGERVFKDAPQTEAYGAVDEAVAALAARHDHAPDMKAFAVGTRRDQHRSGHEILVPGRTAGKGLRGLRHQVDGIGGGTHGAEVSAVPRS